MPQSTEGIWFLIPALREASSSLSFFHFALIILQRNKLNLSARNLIEVSSWKSFNGRKERAEERLLINSTSSSFTGWNRCRGRANDILQTECTQNAMICALCLCFMISDVILREDVSDDTLF